MINDFTLIPLTVIGVPSCNYDGSSTDWYGDPIEKLDQWQGKPLTEEQRSAVNQYVKFNTQNKHKMVEIPTFKL